MYAGSSSGTARNRIESDVCDPASETCRSFGPVAVGGGAAGTSARNPRGRPDSARSAVATTSWWFTGPVMHRFAFAAP